MLWERVVCSVRSWSVLLYRPAPLEPDEPYNHWPLLAHDRYGLGKDVACASEALGQRTVWSLAWSWSLCIS